jgi:PTS system mannose-specific IID component
MATKQKRLSKWDIVKSWFLWLTFSHACYNYERLQASAFAHAMAPIIKKLYDKKEDIVEGLQRHLVFFNTEPNVGAVIHGVTIAMEEEKANGAPIDSTAINSIKTGLMGPLAGIGDTITQGTITPILLAFGIGLAKEGNLMGPVLYTILISAAIIGLSYVLWMQGYRMGSQAVEKILEGGLLNNVVTAAGVLGCTVIGALTGKYVSLSTKLKLTVGQAVVDVQADIFDKIMPKMLPLLLTLGVFWLVRKGKNPITVLVYIVVLGVVGSVLKVF